MGKRCGNCANGTWLKGMDAVPEVCLECGYVNAEPSNWKPKEQTNADRIRAMSDEELAKVPAKFGYSCVFPQKECAESDTCEKCLLEWLKQPTE